MLTNILEQQWFSPLEARVYLATLELGQAPAGQIARKLQENRVTVYSCLQGLMKRDIIITVVKNKVMNYSAISPKNLLRIAQEKADLLSEKMPEMLALSTLFNDKPSTQFYEGVEGLKMLYEDILQYPSSTIKSFLWYGEVEKGLERYLNYIFLPARLKKKISAQVILPQSLKDSIVYDPVKDSKKKLTKIRFVSDTDFIQYNEINLYGEEKVSIVMFSENEMMGLLIKSKTLYKTFSSLFDLTRKRETDEE